MRILNCPIDHATLEAWKSHFAPTTQPFFARRQFPLPSRSGSRWLASGAAREALNLSAHDTFATYQVASDARHLLLLDESAFAAMPPELRGELLHEQLAVGRGSVFQVQDLAERWRQIQRALPGIPSRAGTFHPDSGPNCFGAVIEAFTGRHITRRTERYEFEAWLSARIAGPDAADELGTVLLWRDDHETLQHAAVSLGDGYAFHKEAQTWWSPWQVVRLTEVIERWQDAGPMTSIRLAI